MKTKTEFLDQVKSQNPGEPEFHQAVEEFINTVWDFASVNPTYQSHSILERIVEPERTISFRVTWLDDEGVVQVNKGYRVQFNGAIGPYKGGIRFHPTVNLSVLKFLGFEQIFKNSLTSLPMGGGKGGADFDPKGKSDAEIMRFCQAFMLELCRHIGADLDVPAGDIGVGGKEVGYMFGMYRKIKNEFTGVFTGKGISSGGSLIRPEATGYGLLYFVQSMLATQNNSIEGKIVAISGAGNVAQFAAEKAIQLGAKVVTMSDSGGFVYDPDGIDAQKLEFIKELKNIKRGRISEYAQKFSNAKYFENQQPWQNGKYDIALPCATQNEIKKNDAEALAANGTILVAEGANMPSTLEAIEVFQHKNVMFGPAKACNAGGVATSGLEMSQNSIRMSWSREEVDEKLKNIMKNIHDKCEQYGKTNDGRIDYVKGANIAGFKKVADAMVEQGIV